MLVVAVAEQIIQDLVVVLAEMVVEEKVAIGTEPLEHQLEHLQE
jgi:hypothetical protein